MIEGNLEDISLPGLLQLLAAESTKSYRLRISKGGQHGDVFVCDGHLLVATFGILEGLDALSEFLNWSDGEFVVEKLPTHFKTTIRSNINLNLSDPGCFSDQCAFLYESNVGLNTEIVPSRTFGTAEWQEALHVQPLGKDDYVVLGWITDGRTMRQAMREFQFDLKKTIGVLYRLLITRSVEVVRPTAYAEPASQADNFVKLANKELARHTSEPTKKHVTVEFHATDIGGARARPRDTGSGMRALAPASPSDNDSLTGEAKLKDVDGELPSKDSNSKTGGSKAPPKDADEKQTSKDGDGKSPTKEDAKPAAKEVDRKPKEEVKVSAKEEVKPSPKDSPKEEVKPSAKEDVKPVSKDADTKSSKDADAKSPNKDAAEAKSNSNGDAQSQSKPEATAKAEPPKQSNVGVDTAEVATLKSLEMRSQSKNLSEAIAGEADELQDNFKKQFKKSAGTTDVPAVASAKSAPSAELAESAGSTNGGKSGATTANKLPASAATLNVSADSSTKSSDVPEKKESRPNSLQALLNPDFDKEADAKKAEKPEEGKVSDVVAPAAKQFDERRTDPLPLVSIDIERLINSTFQLTAIGQRALSNTSLDELLKQVLLDVEKGKSLLLVLTDSNRSESAVLASYRYCMDRGYIEHSDSVMSLTIDLLLGRLELEQYLLQRRRITGDQLRDMVAISHRQGIGLDKLFVAAGYMLPVDMERVRKEKERFCPR